jgi:hypothetical protein
MNRGRLLFAVGVLATGLVTAVPGAVATADDGPVTGPAPGGYAAEVPQPVTGHGAVALAPAPVPTRFVLKHPDGSFEIQLVSPAPAGTPEVPPPSGVLDAGPVMGTAVGALATVPPGGDGGCASYGFARGELANDGTCPVLHWERFSTSVAYMYIEDHTSAKWPVYASQIEWNKSCCVGAYYAGSQCPSTVHCVKAVEGYYGTAAPYNWFGYTRWTYDANHHFVSVDIRYNNSYALNATQIRHTTCMEQGHALGLDHEAAKTSCMYNPINATDNLKLPSADDYNMLKYKIYNH